MTNKIEKMLPHPVKKEQLKLYNENPSIERPSVTIGNINKRKAVSKENADVLLSFILQRLVGADPDITAGSSDVRLEVGEKPVYDVKSEGGWVRDDRFPVITQDIMDFIFDYVIPNTNKENIVKKKTKGIYSVDEDFAIDFVVNSNFDYSSKDENVENAYSNKYATRPQYLVANNAKAETRLSRFRGNLTRAKGTYVIILRKIDSEIPDFFDLGLNIRFLEFLENERGLVLVTGPTGSGKSTTLAALINEINKNQQKHIITLENPVEFVHTNKRSFFTQRDIPGDSASFEDGIRSALRQKPDIILFGEMRDQETISGAIEAAETGHLVFGTLHTFNAAKTVDRLLNSFPENVRSQVASSLAGAFVGAISQTLVRTKKGGITALNEMVKGTDGVKAAINEMISAKIAASAGNDPASHLTMVNHAVELVKKGIVDPNEIYKKIFNEDVVTYENLIMKLKSENLYVEKNDSCTLVNREKLRKEREKMVLEKMGIKKEDKKDTSGLSETAKIEEELLDGEEKKSNGSDLLL